MKLISRAAGLAAATLVAGTMAAFPTVAANATSAAILYDCTHPIAGKHVFSVVAETDAPPTIEVGKSFTPKMTATVDVPNGLRDLLFSIGARSIEGTTADGKSSDIGYAVNGVAATMPANIPVTPISDTAALQVVATGTGAAITPAAAGEVKITAGNFTAVLAGKDSSGAATLFSPYVIPCTVKTVDDNGTPEDPADDKPLVQDLTVDTVKVTPAPTPDPEPVVKADTKTKVTGKYIKKKKMIKAVVKVTGGETKATGKAKVVVKLGKKTVKKLNAKVKNGKAVAKIKKITRKGKYKIKVTYTGDSTHKPSKGKTVVKVK